MFLRTHGFGGRLLPGLFAGQSRHGSDVRTSRGFGADGRTAGHSKAAATRDGWPPLGGIGVAT